MKRVTIVALAATSALGLALGGAAHAAPFALAPLGSSDDGVLIEQVRQGCGPGAHRNIYGECRADLPSRPRYGYRGYGGGGYGYGQPRPRYRSDRGFYGARPY